MKKLVFFLASSMLTTPLWADFSTSAVAKWDAQAVKDTSSALVVTPLSTLDFNYAAGVKKFNTVTGAYDISLANPREATDLKITAKILQNTLSRNIDQSTLTVGAQWNGRKLSNQTALVLLDSSQNIKGELNTVLKRDGDAERTSAQDRFIFNIDSATSDGTNKTNVDDLGDGSWAGKVAVLFTASWVEP